MYRAVIFNIFRALVHKCPVCSVPPVTWRLTNFYLSSHLYTACVYKNHHTANIVMPVWLVASAGISHRWFPVIQHGQPAQPKSHLAVWGSGQGHNNKEGDRVIGHNDQKPHTSAAAGPLSWPMRYDGISVGACIILCRYLPFLPWTVIPYICRQVFTHHLGTRLPDRYVKTGCLFREKVPSEADERLQCHKDFNSFHFSLQYVLVPSNALVTAMLPHRWKEELSHITFYQFLPRACELINQQVSSLTR